MKKNYLVTGGTGFLGRSLVEKLLSEGNNVAVLDNESRGSVANFLGDIKKIDFIIGDIRDSEFVKKACKGIDSIIHLAYVNGTENFYKKPDVVLDVAVKGMSNILDGAIAAGVSEFFLASSSEVYNEPSIIPTPENVPLIIPDPFNPRYSYSGGKIICELLAINNSKHFKKMIIFRPHNVYGPAMGFEHVVPQFIMRMHELKQKNNSEFIIQGDGTQSRSFIYIDDFIKGLLLLMKKGNHNEIYNIGTREEMTMRDLALLVGKLFEIPITIKESALTAGSPQRRCPDIHKLISLGFKPNTSISEGLRKTIPWYTNV